ncbi:MAG TPA: hypothetical protein VG865_09670 [Casimicrobiaceae bacterium]|nr:hypothetical protein [Casimicrobiaceae bacterium]
MPPDAPVPDFVDVRDVFSLRAGMNDDGGVGKGRIVARDDDMAHAR